jgi:hypothetical protein
MCIYESFKLIRIDETKQIISCSATGVLPARPPSIRGLPPQYTDPVESTALQACLSMLLKSFPLSLSPGLLLLPVSGSFQSAPEGRAGDLYLSGKAWSNATSNRTNSDIIDFLIHIFSFKVSYS